MGIRFAAAMLVTLAMSATASAGIFVENPTDPAFDNQGESGFEPDLTGIETEVFDNRVDFKVEFLDAPTNLGGSLQLDIVNQTSNKKTVDVEPLASAYYDNGSLVNIPDFVNDALDVEFLVDLSDADPNKVALVNTNTNITTMLDAVRDGTFISFSIARDLLGDPVGDVHYGAVVGDRNIGFASDYLDQDNSGAPTMGVFTLTAATGGGPDPVPEPLSLGIWGLVLAGGVVAARRRRRAEKAQEANDAKA